MVDGIEYPCEQVPQVVRKDFFRVNASTLAQSFHITPDVAAVKGLSTPGGKHRAAGFALFMQIDRQQLA